MEIIINTPVKATVFPKIEARLYNNLAGGLVSDEIDRWSDVDLCENRMSGFNSELEKMEYEWAEYEITGSAIKPNAKTGGFYESEFNRKETIFPMPLKGWSSVTESDTVTEMPYEDYADYLEFNPHLETHTDERFYITWLYTATATSVCGCEWVVNMETVAQPSWGTDIPVSDDMISWVVTPNEKTILLEEHETYNPHEQTTKKGYHEDLETLVNIVEIENLKPEHHLDTCTYRENHWKHEKTTGNNMIGINRDGNMHEILSVCKAPTYENIHPVINPSFAKELFWAEIQSIPENFTQEKIDTAIDSNDFFIIMPEPYELEPVTPAEARVQGYN